MVKTRSQPEDEAAAVPQVTRFDDPPRSPSTERPTAGLSAAATILERRGTGGAAPLGREVYMSPITESRVEPSTSRLTAGTGADEPPRRQVSPARSIASNSSVNARVRQAQFEAEERLALIRQKQLDLETERVKRRLAYDMEAITEQEDTEPQGTTLEQRRVQTWLDEAKEHRTPHNTEHRVSDLRPAERPRSPTPGKGSRGRGVDQLVEALEKLARNRPPPRQAYELPVFSGAPIEWFAFRAAMRDTTKTYNLSKAENMARLRNCLKGEAREAVSVLLHTAEDPQVIMNTLDQTFGQPEVIVEKTIEDLKKLPRPGVAATELNNFAVKVQNIVWVLKSIDKRGYLYNPQLTRDIMTKLSPHMLSKWYEYAEQNTSEVEIIAMSQFLMKEASRALRFGYISTATSTQKKEPAKTEQRRGKQVYATTNDSETLRKCQVCQQNHALTKCGKFLQMNITDRWELVKKERLCFKCLISRHRRIYCRAKACGVKECRMGHHQLLHEHHTAPSTGGAQTPHGSNEPANAETVTATSDLGQVKLKICPVTLTGPKGQAKVYALLDEGSTVSLVDEEVARKIGAKGPTGTLRIRGVNACQQEHESRLVKFQIAGANGRDYTIKARTIGDMKLSPQSMPRDLLRLDHLKDLDADGLCYDDGKPQLLIGSDNWELIVTRELRLGKRNEPGASRTQLGWVIHGTVPRRILQEEADNVLHVVEINERLEELVERHFRIDALGVALKPKVRAEDERAVAIFNQTAKQENERFKFGLPWREEKADGTAEVALVAAKAKVAPLRSQTIPSLELKAAVTRNENSSDTEESVLQLQVTVNDSLPDIHRFSNFERLIRATAVVILFIERCRRKTRHPLDARHLREAEKLWIQRSQAESFNTELQQLRLGKKIAKSSRLFRLDPTYCDGILKLNGRIGAADVSGSMKRPIILDGRHPFTKLLVQHHHKNAGHANPERVVNDVRQQYWVLRLRPAVRAATSSCAVCRIRRAKPEVPVMGDLPIARIQAFVRPFSNCGVDYFGPMVVTIGRRHEKRWGALFTCLTTRAIHLELVASLSTDSAIMALRRMAARRGWPTVIYSDNGTNFRGADAELRAAYKEWAPALQNYGLQHRVTWRFIPPGAPNQGGAWERLVRSVKAALSHTLSQKAPKEEVLLTLLMEAEHSINARPLTHVSVDPNDPEALTPNHFLLGTSSGLPTTGPCEPADRRAWRAAQALADEFWRRWVREYLPSLTPRRASAAEIRPLREGDLVVVVDPTLPRNTWPRGVVERVFPGSDGHVRVADVRTRGGTFRRPATKLAVLPVESCDESSLGGEC